MGSRLAGLGTVISLALCGGAVRAAEPIGVTSEPEPAPVETATSGAPVVEPPPATPPAATPATPATTVIVPSTHAEEPEPVPDEPIERRFAFKANYGFGFFWPSDVNDYFKRRLPDNTNSVVRSLANMYLLFSADVSVAYFPKPFFGIRPNLLYLFAYQTIPVSGGGREFFWLHSLAPGLSLDFVLETRKLARFFASPGVTYQFGWFDGYAARGLGVELALGTELSFGRRRNKGASIALVLRYADLGVTSGPKAPPGVSTIESLNFSSVMVRLGFQYGS